MKTYLITPTDSSCLQRYTIEINNNLTSRITETIAQAST